MQLPHADSQQMKPSSFASDMDSATAPCRLHPAPPPRFLIVINMTQNGWQATHPLMPGKVLTGTLSAFLTQRKASPQLLSKYKFIHKNKTTTIAFNYIDNMLVSKPLAFFTPKSFWFMLDFIFVTLCMLMFNIVAISDSSKHNLIRQHTTISC